MITIITSGNYNYDKVEREWGGELGDCWSQGAQKQQSKVREGG